MVDSLDTETTDIPTSRSGCHALDESCDEQKR